MQQNATQYQEDDTKGLLDDGNFSEIDVEIEDLLERNNTLNDNIRELKREHEIQVVKLC